MKIEKIITLVVLGTLLTQHIYAQQLENKLYFAIKNNKPEDVQKVLAEEIVDSSGVTPIIHKINLKMTSTSGHSFLHDALENFLKYAEKPLKLKKAEMITKGASVVPLTTFGCVHAQASYSTSSPETKLIYGLVAAISFLLAASNAVDLLKSYHYTASLKNNLGKSKKIIDLIVQKMLDQKLMPDPESQVLMANLTPQLKDVFKPKTQK